MSNNRREAIIERIMLARYEFSLITARLDLAKGISVLEFLNIQEVFDNLNTAVEAYMRECENKIKALKESHENGP
ncbi:MAG: hypothetical protein RBS57_03445 [Desulforhabdus sp.]|jgi:hypothetical protein|nr:hypothetical protein [Desulforhabdus sp.]